MTCDEFRENADAFALGAIDGAEAAELRDHLAACPACAAEYRAAVAVASRLALGVPLVRAPAALRSSVLDAVAREGDRGYRVDPDALSAPSEDERTSPAPLSGRDGTPVAAAQDAAPRGRRLLSLARGRLRPTWTGAVAAAFALAALGLGLWAVTLLQRVHNLEYSRDAARAVAVGLLPGGSAGDSQLTRLLTSRDTVASRLQTQPSGGEATGAIVWSPDQRRCAVIVRQLAPLGPGWQYHVWFASRAGTWDSGVLVPDAMGMAQDFVDTSRWHVDYSYTVNIVAQPSPDDGTRLQVLSGVVSVEQ